MFTKTILRDLGILPFCIKKMLNVRVRRRWLNNQLGCMYEIIEKPASGLSSVTQGAFKCTNLYTTDVALSSLPHKNTGGTSGRLTFDGFIWRLHGLKIFSLFLHSYYDKLFKCMSKLCKCYIRDFMYVIQTLR